MSPPVPLEPRQPQLWRRAYEIFDLCLERPAAERHAFVHLHAGSEPELLTIVLELIRNASEEDLDGEPPHDWRVPGARVGRYEITGILGRGGMGTVYAARDSELGRAVALKLLSASGASDRLIREAKAASALNHPNVVSIHDVVRHGDEIAIAMELVEGHPLRWYCGRPQPLEQIVEWGAQIAQALAATHARGIVHRDIKPENVMVRPDGYVKMLDFGLARRERLPGASSVQSSVHGKLGGTLSYMSPEQARGETAQAPSDIFSLGVVLYELACGRHPFASASPIGTAYAIAHQRPQRPEGLPESFSDLLIAMLERNPEDRPTAAEVGQRLSVVSTGERRQPESVRKSPLLRWLGGAVLLIVLGFTAWHWAMNRTVTPSSSFAIPVSAEIDCIAISPRGDQIAYQTASGLFRRNLQASGKYGDEEPVPGAENAVAPFFSPDGKEVGYFVNDSIRAATRSAYRFIAHALPAHPQASWGEDGFIYFNQLQDGTPGIWRVPARGGGRAELVLNSDATPRGFAFRLAQQWQPGGLIYSENLGPVTRSIEWLDFPGGATQRVVERGMGGRVLASGDFMYYWQGSLFVAAYDRRRHTISGPAAQVMQDVRQSGWVGPVADVSQTGTLAYCKQGDLPRRKLVWVMPSGREVPVPITPDDIEQAEVSPDGTRIAIIRFNARRHWVLSLYDVKRNSSTTLIETPYEKLRAIWKPDSKSLLVARTPEGRDFANLWVFPIDAPDRAERLTDQPAFGQYPMAWSEKAQGILLVEGIHPKSESDIMLYSTRTGEIKTLVATPLADRSPTFSPDGRWFAYSSDSEQSVFLQDVAQSKRPRKISKGINPLWSPKGDKLFFLNADAGLMEVPVDNDGNAGVPRQRIARDFTFKSGDYWTRNYSVTNDGRFLVIRNVAGPVGRPEIRIIVNWFSDLNRLVPIR
jgi:serine/threonine protein kinase